MKITFELDTEEEPNLAKGILALPDISMELEELGQLIRSHLKHEMSGPGALTMDDVYERVCEINSRISE